MQARIAVDVDVVIAEKSLRAAGIAQDDIACCHSPQAASQAWAQGKFIAAADLSDVLELPIDVVVEATGQPEAGARHCRLAIEAGRHVALVSKEVDSVVGPYLAHLARQRAKIVTPVDGDQPSLLIGLITWAEALGFEIVAAGKSSEYDFVYDADSGCLTSNGTRYALPRLAEHMVLGQGDVRHLVDTRAALCADVPQRATPDLCEMLVVANATGFLPDRPDLHAPIARTAEVASVLGPVDEGGLLAPGSRRVLEVFNCLRRPDEVSFAGGVFVIVRCEDPETWELLAAKGHALSRDRQRAMLYLPRHLLGLEAATSVLEAAVHGRSSGSRSPCPRLDLVARATRRLAAGSVLAMGGHHHSIAGISAELQAAQALAGQNPVPFYLAANRRLVRDVEPGDLIGLADLEIDPASELLNLRRLQDTLFF